MDLRKIGNPGIGHYMSYLFDALLDLDPVRRYVLILPSGWDPGPLRRSNVEVHHTDLRYYSVREQIVLPVILQRLRIDLLHSPHFLLPVVRPCRTIVTIHDAIYLVNPRDLHGSLARLYYPLAFQIGARLADRVITVSDFSKREIASRTGINVDRIVTIPEAAADMFQRVGDQSILEEVRARYSLSRPFFLYVGIQRHRKNLPSLIEAFGRLVREGNATHHLVLAGMTDPRYKEIPELVGRLLLNGRVRFLGYVPDEDLPALYTLADALVMPSLYEGFGLPIVEAMACGTPVITSNTTAAPEVAGNAALLVDPTSVEAIAAAMDSVIGDLGRTARLRAAGLARAAQFSWINAAKSTLQVYDEVLA